MSYQGAIGNLRIDTQRKVMAAWRMYAKGMINRSQFTQLAAALMGQSNTFAAALADLSMSAELSRLDLQLRGVAGVDAASKRDTYQTALETILGGDGDIAMQLERLSLNVPLEAAQVAYDKAIASSGKGWVRQLEGDPCQLCRWWWREGQVWPADHPMPTHPGCECVARPVNE